MYLLTKVHTDGRGIIFEVYNTADTSMGTCDGFTATNLLDNLARKKAERYFLDTYFEELKLVSEIDATQVWSCTVSGETVGFLVVELNRDRVQKVPVKPYKKAGTRTLWTAQCNICYTIDARNSIRLLSLGAQVISTKTGECLNLVKREYWVSKNAEDFVSLFKMENFYPSNQYPNVARFCGTNEQGISTLFEDGKVRTVKFY